MTKIIDDAAIPPEIRDLLRAELPPLIESVQLGLEKAVNPSTIWLESMQFADYVGQFGQHLVECGAEECTNGIGQALVNMAKSYKFMAESALTVIDEMEKEDNGAQA